jgi:hypothetical protein
MGFTSRTILVSSLAIVILDSALLRKPLHQLRKLWNLLPRSKKLPFLQEGWWRTSRLSQ